MDIQENVSLKAKTTMRIGGNARYFADLETKEDVEQAVQFAAEYDVPIIPLGGGSNTVFADGTIGALVVRIKANTMTVEGNTVTLDAGKILAMAINELAEQNLDLSALTGIPGAVGGAIFGNAGQGPAGTWIDAFVESVEAFVEGEWKTFSKEDCGFRYRESRFKDQVLEHSQHPIVWSATLNVPTRPAEEIQAEVESLLQRRIETQPHVKTAGSCFKALPDGTPAWKLIDAAGLRGIRIGSIEVSEKHANFLLNTGDGSMEDIQSVVEKILHTVPEIGGIEMRLIGKNGKLL